MSRSNTGLWNGSYGEIGATLKSLEDHGLTLDDLKAIRTYNDLAGRIVEVIKAHTAIATSADTPLQVRSLPDLRNARSPVYDAHAVNKLLGLGYSGAVILHSFAPPPDALPGFLTFFDPGWDLLRLRTFCADMYADNGKIFFHQDWYDHEGFAHKGETPRYRQIRREAVEDSLSKDFDSQQRLLSDIEEIPLVRAVTMGMVIHFLQTGQRLFERYYVRCADKDSEGNRVLVGNFDARGLDVHRRRDDSRFDSLGLVSARKS